MLWKVGSRLFIQQRIFSKHTRSISLHGYLSGEAEVTVFLKSGRHKSPSAANYYSHPTCWSQRAGGAALRRETCLRSIGCCCSWAPLDGLFKRLHMLVEGGKAAEYIKQALRTTLWSGGRVNGIIKSKWFHPIFWARKSGGGHHLPLWSNACGENVCVCVVECEREWESRCACFGCLCGRIHRKTEEHICLQDGNLGERFHIRWFFSWLGMIVLAYSR